MTLITHLTAINGRRLCSWYDQTRKADIFSDARLEVSDFFDCALSEIDYEELEEGDFFTVNGIPVATLQWHVQKAPAPVETIINLQAAE